MKKKVAYSGIEGAFAYIVSKRIFPEDELISFTNFYDTYDSVVAGECDYAVIPIDNSYSGEVAPVMDMLFYGDLYINGIYSLPVVQNLLVIPGTKLEDVKTVMSHPKALEQCDEYIKAHDFRMMHASNTAIAAKEVSDKKDKSLAAIASAETASLYGLEVLDSKINETEDNTTRFLVLSKNRGMVQNTDKSESFIMLFTVGNLAGSLVKALQVIGIFDFNMKVVHSRPLKNHIWEYYFYVEIEGNYNTPKGAAMISALENVCSMVKVAGPYKEA